MTAQQPIRLDDFRPTTTTAPEQVLTVAQSAEHLQCHKKTIYGLVESGELRCIRVGRSIRIPASALADFIAGRGT